MNLTLPIGLEPQAGVAPELLGLTLTLPWPWCMMPAHAGSSPALAPIPENLRKLVENREWPPPPSVKDGAWFLLHAGKEYDRDDAAKVRKLIDYVPSLAELRAAGQVGALLAWARVVDVIQGSPTRGSFQHGSWRGLPRGQERWFFGPYGWVLDVRPLPVPIPCRGWHKLWSVRAWLRKDNLEEKVTEICDGLLRDRARLVEVRT